MFLQVIAATPVAVGIFALGVYLAPVVRGILPTLIATVRGMLPQRGYQGRHWATA
jgi:hypothetical protein